MGNSESSANVSSELGFKPRIVACRDFDGEETAKLLHKAFHKTIRIDEKVIMYNKKLLMFMKLAMEKITMIEFRKFAEMISNGLNFLLF